VNLRVQSTTASTQSAHDGNTSIQTWTLQPFVGSCPPQHVPLCGQSRRSDQECFERNTSKVTFVRAQKETKRTHDDATIKSSHAAKRWLSILDDDDAGHELGRVTHSDFEMLKVNIRNKSIVVVVPVPSDDAAGETMNQHIRLK
jgi:hypothetical protein